MLSFFHGWRRKAGVVTLVICTIGVCVTLLARFLDPFDEEPFIRSTWILATQEDRAKMARDVIAKHLRHGMTPEEVVAMFGKPDKNPVQNAGDRIDIFGNRLRGVKTYAYYLGSWSLAGLDSAFLYVHFDGDDHVVKAEVAGG